MCTMAGLLLGPLPAPFPVGLPAEGLLFAALPLAAFLRDMSQDFSVFGEARLESKQQPEGQKENPADESENLQQQRGRSSVLQVC